MTLKQSLRANNVVCTYKGVVRVVRVLVQSRSELNEDVADEEDEVPLRYQELVIGGLEVTIID